MAAGINITFRTEPEQRDELDKIAQSLDRDRTWVINEAIRNYLELQHWQIEQIDKGLKAARQGRFVSHEEVGKRIERMIARSKPAQRGRA